MTPEAQRIAIAEACGFTELVSPPVMVWMGRTNGRTERVPDYLNDLNAMHEAEKVLTDEQQSTYYSSKSWERFGFGDQSIWHRNEKVRVSATAAQRAEAFLKTLGLWKDD